MAYRQTVGAIAGLYEFAPQEEAEAPEIPENRQGTEFEPGEAQSTVGKLRIAK